MVRDLLHGSCMFNSEKRLHATQKCESPILYTI
jgi:hypothetical protein